MPGLVEIPTPFHYIMKEQKLIPNPETGDSLKGSVLTASCRAASQFTPRVFIVETGFSQCDENLHRLQYSSLNEASLLCADAPGQNSRVFPEVSITVT